MTLNLLDKVKELCGVELTLDMMLCSKCGRQMTEHEIEFWEVKVIWGLSDAGIFIHCPNCKEKKEGAN